MYKKHVYFGLLLGGLVACKGTNNFSALQPHSDLKVTDNSRTLDLDDKSDSYRYSQLFSGAKFIPLVTPAPDSLVRIDNMLYYNGLYLVFDRGQRKIFGMEESGRRRFVIGGVDSSGGTPLNILDYTVNVTTRTLDVFYGGEGKIVQYNMDGMAVKEISFPFVFREFASNGKGEYVLYAPLVENTINGKQATPALFVTDASGKYLRTLMDFIPDGKNRAYVQAVNCLAGYGDSITLVSNYTPDIYLLTNEEMAHVYSVSFGGEWLTSMLQVQASGGSMSISYFENHPPANPLPGQVLAGAGEKPRIAGQVTNDLFPLRIITPCFFKTANTMTGIVSTVDFLKAGEYSQIWHEKSSRYNVLSEQAISTAESLPAGVSHVLIEFPWR